DLRARDLDAALLADDPLVAHALVLAAVALPVLRGTEDALAEEPVALGLERPVVDRLRLRHLARAPAPDLLGAGEADLDCVEVVDVQGPFFAPALVASHLLSGCRAGRRLLLDGRLLLGAGAIGAALALAHDLLLALVGGSVAAAVGADAGEVDADLLLGPLDLAALGGDQVHVQAQALDLLEQDLEGLGDGRLRDVLRLDDRLVGLDAADGGVGLHGQHLLERVRGAVRLQRPHRHLAEALAAELRLAAQRLLGDERVGARRARVDLVVHEVQQLQDVHVADRDAALVGLPGAAVEEPDRARGALARAPALVDAEVDPAIGVLLLPAHE